MRLLAILLVSVTLAPPLRGAPDPLWLVRLDFGLRYDDNILRYSDLYLRAFETREDPGRFHIGTTDDAVADLGLRVERILLPEQDLRTTLFAEGGYSRYLRNPVKNWGTVGAGLRQELPFRALLTVAYEFIPAFYLRHYRDQDWVDAGVAGAAAFQPYAYERDELRTALSAVVPTGTSLRFGVAAGRLYHNEHFTEYDARTTTWLWEASQRIDPLRVTLRYEFETGRSLRIAAGLADASYDEDALRAAVTLPVRWAGRRFTLDAAFAWSRRCFTTRAPVAEDPLHAGRVDRTVAVTVGGTFALTPELDVGLLAAFRNRDAAGVPGNDAYLSLERDFTQFTIEANAAYAFRF